jgi:hypothetical protein
MALRECSSKIENSNVLLSIKKTIPWFEAEFSNFANAQNTAKTRNKPIIKSN